MRKAAATPPTITRRRRFLQIIAAVVLRVPEEAPVRVPGRSPGKTCCKGMCVDTEYSNQHCVNCNKTCKFGDTCCAGQCVNLLTHRNNCGVCGVTCSSHDCMFGFCDYSTQGDAYARARKYTVSIWGFVENIITLAIYSIILVFSFFPLGRKT
jgi:hypothetical protein